MNQRYVARLYADGVTDGMRIALQLFLGDGAPEGGVPCPQPLTEDAERWARAALDRIQAYQAVAS